MAATAGSPGGPQLLAGRYELQSAVGRGGMADVWRAQDLLLGRTVAIKLFRGGTGHDARQRIEAVALASLSHPGLVTVFDAVLPDESEQGDTLAESYLVTEFVEGSTLRARLASGRPMSAAEVAQLGQQMADALAYVHAAGIVHRDVKPANVLLASAGPGLRAKLADFGVALLAGADRLTEHGTVVGTANYLSPEQLTGTDVGPASDVYSLGLVLIECLTGAAAYPGTGLEAALARLQRPPEIPVGLNAHWRELLGAMVAAEPSARPPAAEVASRLAALGGDQATVQLDPVLPPPGATTVLPVVAAERRPADRRAADRLRWLIPAGVAAVVLAVVLAITLPGGSSPAPVPKPSYPHVSGQLGKDLAVLQGDVP